MHCMNNTGQSCNAPTRMLVPLGSMERSIEIAKETITKLKVGDPKNENTTLGPVVNKKQFEKIKNFIQNGINEGATLLLEERIFQKI